MNNSIKTGLFDIRKALSASSAYNLFSKIIGSSHSYSTLIDEYVLPKETDKILDIGCGTAKILDFLPHGGYVGIDISRRYIETAIKKYGNRGTFICERINSELIKKYSNYDIVLALGVLHHLNDIEAKQMFEIAKNALKPGGRLITVDGCYVGKQSRFVRYLLSKDRGKYVRSKDGYLAIAAKVFSKIRECIRNDMIFIPYTHIIMECMA